jgi:alkylated DNA repair dioxygenase AlkB
MRRTTGGLKNDFFERKENSSTFESIGIQGLNYIPNFIDKSEMKCFVDAINDESWMTDIKRRVQHYGYRYDYKARRIDHSMFIGTLPSWAMPMAKKLYDEKHMSEMPDQLIINEYYPGQGISSHVDCEKCFGDTIVSISLVSSCVMSLINTVTKQKVDLLLEPGSLLSLSGEARYDWSHGIAQRKTDSLRGVKTERGLRISMTFRKVILK